MAVYFLVSERPKIKDDAMVLISRIQAFIFLSSNHREIQTMLIFLSNGNYGRG